MKFGQPQSEIFGTSSGTYSVVTDREYFDSQITATDDETILLNSFFGIENIHVGNVSSDRDQAKKYFRLYPSGEWVGLNLVYPKPGKTELRLYLSQRAGFKPEGGQVWFLFSRNNEIWIGSTSEAEWRFQSQFLTTDDSDSFYQGLLQAGSVATSRVSERDVYTRNRNIAIQQMEAANFQCENDASHNLFISNSTNLPYLEAHHLVPMSLQKTFEFSLDNSHNIYCLCPNCHRAIHHAVPNQKKEIIHNLVQKRTSVLGMLAGGIGEIYNIYSVEDID